MSGDLRLLNLFRIMLQMRPDNKNACQARDKENGKCGKGHPSLHLFSLFSILVEERLETSTGREGRIGKDERKNSIQSPSQQV